MKAILSTTCAALLIAAAASTGQAATLARYEFGSGTTGSYAATTVDPLLVSAASDITVAGANSATFRTTAATNGTTGTASAPTLQINPFAAGSAGNYSTYFQFTLTPTEGGVDLQQFALDASKGTTGTSVRGFEVLYSFNNNFTGSNFSSLGNTVIPSETSSYTFNRSTFNLTDQTGNVTTSPITFRVTVYSDTANTGLAFDNVTVTGAAVPEPSTVLTLLGGAGMLGMLRRRRG